MSVFRSDLMTSSAVSASVSVISAAVSGTSSTSASTTSTSSKLVQLANGEYTASSVASDQTDANKLGLIKEKDGNYGTSQPTVASSGTAASQASSGVQSALTSLPLGGT